MITIQIHFDEGPVVRLDVSPPVLLSMLEVRPDLQGVTFRKDLTFSVVQGRGQKRLMTTSQIHLVEETS